MWELIFFSTNAKLIGCLCPHFDWINKLFPRFYLIGICLPQMKIRACYWLLIYSHLLPSAKSWALRKCSPFKLSVERFEWCANHINNSGRYRQYLSAIALQLPAVSLQSSLLLGPHKCVPSIDAGLVQFRQRITTLPQWCALSAGKHSKHIVLRSATNVMFVQPAQRNTVKHRRIRTMNSC